MGTNRQEMDKPQSLDLSMAAELCSPLAEFSPECLSKLGSWREGGPRHASFIAHLMKISLTR